ncbi:bifunctional folylpolyglutamate synthase/dihydrofolate synthase [Spirulina major CS-329]|uniref:bifunctional folylpolyglutamate synthase/dihydrofolate synthase n=1 Tax=Spirulina TaxID=1154 RepID=UPI0023304089|nr:MULTISPECIES: folylpolyglutamate synthase/dihydrofolate synthase family protein [Spirulina]MDB9493104.1 bifunctional folylpolyglutamate synthase/dihydrofolate synthase [Spirulina subsalsa CS-330]MDB9503096.1 bifunctional folylpolyglutamate synthase/dihydrofolate synthase [Spirulina major CS-329]
MLHSPITDRLRPYQTFGVNLGLDRIQHLLHRLGDPHLTLPIIHVGGTNGKGSVCAYLAAVLTAAGDRVGRYTSPHLVDWPERFWCQGELITLEALDAILGRVIAAIDPDTEPPTVFELVTAAAWLYFAEQRVDVAVMEVGLGGRLDATNVCDRPLVSVITSLTREHWQRLGPTLADIAREKAGILKPGRPAVLGQFPPEAHRVIAARAEALACPTQWVKPAQWTTRTGWATWQGFEYPVALVGDVQLQNSALAVAAVQELRSQGWNIPAAALIQGMGSAQWPGRLQWDHWQGRDILLDGAHNTAAAEALRTYLDHLTPPQPTTWVMGMLATKDHRDIFTALLREGDRLHLVPVPDHLTAAPDNLQTLAREVCPTLAACYCHEDLFPALTAACQSSGSRVVFCGSLYLLGYFFRERSHRA